MESSLPSTVCMQFKGRSWSLVGDSVEGRVDGSVEGCVVGSFVVGGGDGVGKLLVGAAVGGANKGTEGGFDAFSSPSSDRAHKGFCFRNMPHFELVSEAGGVFFMAKISA